MRRESSRTRGVPVPTRPAEFTVEVIAPKLEGTIKLRCPPLLPTLRVPEGCPYCARLKMLKASVRKITLLRSVTWKVFCTAESSCHSGGPVTGLRPALPQEPIAGREKAAGLIQFL